MNNTDSTITLLNIAVCQRLHASHDECTNIFLQSLKKGGPEAIIFFANVFLFLTVWSMY